MRVVTTMALALSVIAPLPASAASDEANPPPVVVPALQSWSGGTGAFELPDRPKVSG